MTYDIVTSQTAIAWSRIPPRGGAIIESAGSDLEVARRRWKEAANAAPKGMVIRLMDSNEFTHEANI